MPNKSGLRCVDDGRLSSKDFLKIVRRYWATIKVSLSLVTTFPNEKCFLGRSLNALSNHGQSQAFA